MTPIAVRIALALLVWAVGCNSNADSDGDSGTMSADVADAMAGDTSVAPSACSWPAELEPNTSTSRDVCHARRALLSCAGPGGATLTCVSDDRGACPEPEPGFESAPCDNQCEEDEYVATCGGVGPGPIPDPPAGCRDTGANPGGITYHCCPCL